MNIEEIYQDQKPMVLNDCEFSSQINDILYSEKMKEEQQETSSTTNIIVTKYADSSSDMLDVNSALNLDNSGKIIEVELLPSNIEPKNKFSSLLNGTGVKKKKRTRKKSDGNANKKFSQNSVKKKKRKECKTVSDDFVKSTDAVSNNNDSEQNSQEVLMCNECNKQFSSKVELKKHLAACKSHSQAQVALCSKCGKNFSSNYNLKRHMTSCKLCPENEKSPRYTCQCGRTYSQEWDMKKHKLKCEDGKKKCKPCFSPDCNLVFYHKAQLIAHMKKDHNVVIEDPKILHFNSFDEFLLWKEKEEEETFTYYSKQTGSNVSSVSVNTYYVCQHDGSDRLHTATPRKTDRRNKKGRIKTGQLCWSQMNVKEFQDKTVTVTYFPSHTHPVSVRDTEHHPLPSSINMEINRRFSEITNQNENEEPQSGENQVKKKKRKRKSSTSLRVLRALARKNRSLFRIAAEAVQQSDECNDAVNNEVNCEVNYEENYEENFQLSSLEALPSDDSIMQVLVTNQEEENVDDPDPVELFNIDNIIENDTQGNNELLEDCINYLNDVKTHLLSGQLPQPLMIQIKESLKNICNMCKEEIQDVPVISNPQNFSDCQELTLYQPQSPLSMSEIFPLQNELDANIELTDDDLKYLETTPEKAIYQIIAVDGEDFSSPSTGNEYLYDNAFEMVGAGEFIIIAGDQAQLFQSVDSNIQFDLNCVNL